MYNEEMMITIKDAADLVKKSKGTIRSYFKDGYVRGARIDGVLRVNKVDLENYMESKIKRGYCNPHGADFSKEDEAFKQLYTMQHGRIVFPKHAIMVGNKGTIYNATLRHNIYGTLDTNEHIQISIDRKIFYVHRLTAMLWCPNRKFKQIVHHINGDTVDNEYTNLLWVTYKEHVKLHKLLSDGKNEEYQKMISDIQRDNQWEEETLYPVIDDETSDERWLDVYMTNYEGYCLLLQGFSVSDLIAKELIRFERNCENEGKIGLMRKKCDKNVSEPKTDCDKKD